MAVSAFDVLASFFGSWNSGDVSFLALLRFAPVTPELLTPGLISRVCGGSDHHRR
jgi:hypothetical protein